MEFIKHFIILTWTELVAWIYQNNDSVKVYVLKVFIAFFLYIIVSDYIRKIFKKIQKSMENRNMSKALTKVGIFIPMYMILSCIIISMFDYLNKIEVSPLVTIVVFLFIFLLLVVKGFFTKLITRAIRNMKIVLRGDDEDIYGSLTQVTVPRVIRSKTMRFFLSIVVKMIGVTIAAFIIYFCYQGIIYMVETGGEEISYIMSMSDEYIAKELGTSFKEDASMLEKIPIFTSGKVTVKTDGELNIIYLDNQRIGFNTTSRKYNIYGVSINQAEIGLKKRTTFLYDQTLHTIENMYGGRSNVTYLLNRETKECMVVIVNNASNRVVSISYFTDFDKVTEELMLTTDD